MNKKSQQLRSFFDWLGFIEFSFDFKLELFRVTHFGALLSTKNVLLHNSQKHSFYATSQSYTLITHFWQNRFQ